MLDVTGCTCPTGLFWRGVYDPTGVQYKVPEWVVVEPDGLVEDHVDDKMLAGPVAASPDAQDDDDDGPDELASVRVRTSHDSKDVILDIHKKDSVAVIIGKLKEAAQVCLFIYLFYTLDCVCVCIYVFMR